MTVRDLRPADDPRPDDVPELPPYRGVVVVDTKEFGSNGDPVQHALADQIPGVVAQAFDRAGLREVWDNALFPHNTGDGYGIGFDTRYLPAVVTRFFDALQDVLAERDTMLRRQSRYTRLRMRASLNVGPVRDADPNGESAVVGRTVITTHRLLDAQPVREVLVRSDPDQTFLSVVLSARVFDDVLDSGFAGLPASKLVPRTVSVKEFTGAVYLYVPNPSGDLLRGGFGEVAEHHEEQPAEPEVAVPTPPALIYNEMIEGNHDIAIQVGNLYGGVHNQRGPYRG